jgi:hypothetical protein
MYRKSASWLAIIPAAMLIAAPASWAQEAPPVRIRGTIERVEDSTYAIKARDGAELKVTLSEKPQIAGVVKARSWA